MEGQVDLEKIFPKYLGFRTLDDSKTRVEESQGEKVFHAVYLAGPDDPVNTIQMHQDFCYVEEFFENRRIALTRSKDLKGVWLQKFTSFGRNPRFKALINRITQGKNVIVSIPGESKRNLISFPEGLMFHLWLPIWDRELMEGIDQAENLRGPLHVRHLHQGTIITMNRDREVIHGSLPILEFTASLNKLEEAVNFCHEKGWIATPFFQEIGLHIFPTADAKPGAFCVHRRDDSSRVIVHSLLLNRHEDISLRQAKVFMLDAVPRNDNGSPQSSTDGKKEPEVSDRLVGDELFGTIVGLQMKKDGILCVPCYREKYGTVVYLGDTEPIYDEKQDRDFWRNTSGLFVGDEEVILCGDCWRVILRIPRFVSPAVPRGN